MASFENLAAGIKALILCAMADLQSLMNLISADPTSRSIFLYYFSSILPSVLGNCRLRDMKEAICTFLALDQAGLISESEVENVLTSLKLDQKDKNLRLPVKIRDPIAAIKIIQETQEAVDYFTWAFARRLCHQPRCLGKCHQQKNQPLTLWRPAG